MHYLITLFILLFILSPLKSQPKHEVRAAWITTAYALDWPKAKATSTAGIRLQKAELTQMLDKLKAANFNTVLFQARTRGDVFYRSQIEPFSALLTGEAGKDPGYDPLAFIIEECHKRGMECHAWMIAIPLGTRSHVISLGGKSVLRTNPDMCASYKGQYFLNPGHEGTRTYLKRLAVEIVDNYDIDGIHLDYLRYPEEAPNFPDGREFAKYGRNKSQLQWRRDNITEIVRHIYKGVKERKPWVKVSSSPLGKYRDTTRYPSGAWNAYHSVHQDVKKWLEEGIQDQIYPMMYFRENNFYPFVLDWQESNCNRHIIPGLGVYFLDPKEGNWTLDEILRQLNFMRSNKISGQGYFRVQHLMENTQSIYDELNEIYYVTPALIPPMTWMNNSAPLPPSTVRIRKAGKDISLSWDHPWGSNHRETLRYVIYGANTYPVDITKSSNILEINVQNTHFIHSPDFPWEEKTFFAITSIDRYGNESEPAQVQIPDH